MWLLEWLSRSSAPAPRSYDAIRADLEAREAPALQRLTHVEESLLSLTAEAGLEDLRRRMESMRHA
jgi:hypothetical protein